MAADVATPISRMMAKPFAQLDLFGAAARQAPVALEGFGYWPEVVSPADEAALAAQIGELPFKPFDFHGYLGNRRVVSYGFRYDYSRRVVDASEAPPTFLLALRAQAAGAVGLPADDFVQVLVNEYAPGAGIGWHRDKPQFGLVIGVSLLAPCVLRFRRKAGEGWDRLSVPVAPRSAYLLAGPARSEWEHSITPMDALRYSVTFRTLA